MQRRVTVDGKEIVLVGTAHVSRESVDEVATVIDREEPDAVCIELDGKRYESLRDETGWQEMDVTTALREGKGTLLLLTVLLSIYQRRLGDAMEVRPGAEMLAAADAAESRDIPVHLVDRDVSETMRAAMQNLTLREKLRLVTETGAAFFGAGEEVTAEDIEALKEQDALEAVVTELGGAYPGLKRAFLDDRDAHMAGRILETDAERIVAVVGAAHLDGVAERLESGDTTVPPPRRSLLRPALRVAEYGIPLAILGMLAYIFLFVGFETGTHAFTVWFLVNGVAATIGAAAARAHPVTVVASFLTAPFTSLNPVLPAGLVAAWVENRMDTPTVADLEAVGDVEDYRAFWDNRALNLLLVFLLVNLGSGLASYIGGGYLAQLIS